LRDISFKTQVFERYPRIEEALEKAIIESYLQRISTRKIEEVISHLGIEKISASYISSVAKELDSKVIESLSRPVELYIPYLFVDASYFKIRNEIKYSNKSLLVIVGSNLMDINKEWITSRRYLSDVEEISPVDIGAEITAY